MINYHTSLSSSIRLGKSKLLLFQCICLQKGQKRKKAKKKTNCVKNEVFLKQLVDSLPFQSFSASGPEESIQQNNVGLFTHKMHVEVIAVLSWTSENAIRTRSVNMGRGYLCSLE